MAPFQQITMALKGIIFPVIEAQEIAESVVFVKNMTDLHFPWKVAGTAEEIDSYFMEKKKFAEYASG